MPDIGPDPASLAVALEARAGEEFGAPYKLGPEEHKYDDAPRSADQPLCDWPAGTACAGKGPADGSAAPAARVVRRPRPTAEEAEAIADLLLSNDAECVIGVATSTSCAQAC